MSWTNMIGDAQHGYLSRSDLALIKKATGQDFNWPPKEGEGFPRVAADLAAERQREMIAGSAIGDLTSKDLAELKRQGILDAAFVKAALAVLEEGKTPGHTSNSSTVENDPRDSTQHVKQDNALYL